MWGLYVAYPWWQGGKLGGVRSLRSLRMQDFLFLITWLWIILETKRQGGLKVQPCSDVPILLARLIWVERSRGPDSQGSSRPNGEKRPLQRLCCAS